MAVVRPRVLPVGRAPGQQPWLVQGAERWWAEGLPAWFLVQQRPAEPARSLAARRQLPVGKQWEQRLALMPIEKKYDLAAVLKAAAASGTDAAAAAEPAKNPRRLTERLRFSSS